MAALNLDVCKKSPYLLNVIEKKNMCGESLYNSGIFLKEFFSDAAAATSWYYYNGYYWRVSLRAGNTGMQ